jgi:hypothetical protein
MASSGTILLSPTTMTTVIARVADVVGVASWHHGHHGLHLGKESSFTSGKGSFTLEHSSIGNFGNSFLDLVCVTSSVERKPGGENPEGETFHVLQHTLPG